MITGTLHWLQTNIFYTVHLLYWGQGLTCHKCTTSKYITMENTANNVNDKNRYGRRVEIANKMASTLHTHRHKHIHARINISIQKPYAYTYIYAHKQVYICVGACMLYKIFTVKYSKSLIQSIIRSLAIWDKHYANLGVKIWWDIKTNKYDIYETENIPVTELILPVAPARGCRVDSLRCSQQYLSLCRHRLVHPNFAPLNRCIYECAQRI